MALLISHDLARLIKARGYAQGRVTKAQSKAARLKVEIERLELICIASRVKVVQLDQEIKRLAPKINAEEIRARAKVRPRRWAYGALNGSLTRLLKEAAGELKTTDLVAWTAKELGISVASVEAYFRHHMAVLRQLDRWADLGLIERVHERNARGIEGRWRWRVDIRLRRTTQLPSN